ncbi:hypothetical protein [Chengkuizengella axinellae]|uniref:Beta-carotene 15,15'-monooxygenase n=1 Tax=Chengkuizengella axinellae TaxID=3064388 RepID=A0ABT9IXJ0_9BACL|nr:hypothetical protein [Chengkuizengella sp. 2205SS18-9]MDP5274091.1 hypothetical protein [Chengkuizengella sp. 2205SS18-9]
MLHALKINRWMWCFLFISIVVLCNVLIYQPNFIQSAPNGIAFATLFDFMITIPVITYFFVIRKQYSLKYIIPVIIASYIVATFVIPSQMLEGYSIGKYIAFIAGAVLLAFEIYMIIKLLMKMKSIIQNYKSQAKEVPYIQHKLQSVLKNHFKSTHFTNIISSEISIWYYSLFTWRKKQASYNNEGAQFTYHSKTSAISVYIMLIHAIVIESIALHILLHLWNPLIAWIAFFLNVYTVLFLIAQIQAIRSCPFIITNQKMYLPVGFSKQLVAELKNIKSIHYYHRPEKLSKKEAKHVYDAVLVDFIKEKPLLEIEFHQPIRANLMYGLTQKVTRVHLTPDDPQQFYNTLCAKINNHLN